MLLNPMMLQNDQMKEIIKVIGHYDKHGCGNDKLLNELPLKSDGEETLRNKGDNHLCWAMVVNHPNVKERRDEKRSKNLLAKHRQIQERNNKYLEKVFTFLLQ